MRRAYWLSGAALALCSALALAQEAPESLLPPGFDDPAPPRRAATPVAPGPVARPATPSVGAPASGAVTAPLATSPAAQAVARRLPSTAELEAMTPDQLDELLGLKPKDDIPPDARRSMSKVGVISADEGGFPSVSLVKQPASLVRASLQGIRGPLVSRWGHILLRRALASRLDAPESMNPVEFATLRASVLNRIGEPVVARALVQDIDTSNYSPAMVNAAFDAYVATGDIVGICPVMRINGQVRKDGQWQLARQICASFSGEAGSAAGELNKALSRGIAPRIDVLLAQRYAGAAGPGRKAVTIEWTDVKVLTPWRFSLAGALGIELPQNLTKDLTPYYRLAAVTMPALPLGQRAEAAELAGARGVLSSEAMVDLYGQVLANGDVTGPVSQRAALLREAYVAADPAERVKAMRGLWAVGTSTDYGRQVLVAYAAARVPANKSLSDDAGHLIAAMLAAGLDRNAMRWATVVGEGSPAWALLALAQPQRRKSVSAGAVEDFMDDDKSEGQRRSAFLVAGLAGLGRLDSGVASGFSRELGMGLGRKSRWSVAIDTAAAVNNRTLVAMLAALGMQGDSWDRMTARHLYHIVSALHRVGMDAEARMIAAEAVARG